MKNVRMAVNSETGKPRGFCFVEYDDAATALSAIRNFNGRDVGGRDLRVNFSNNSALVDYASRGGSGRGGGADSRLPATDITARLRDREVWDVVSEAKRLAEGDAETLGRLLNASGALTSAFVDMLGTLGMVPSREGPVGRLRAPKTGQWLLGAPARRDDAAGHAAHAGAARPIAAGPPREDRGAPRPHRAGPRAGGTTPADGRGHKYALVLCVALPSHPR